MDTPAINISDFLSVGQNAMATRVISHEDAADNYSNDLKIFLPHPASFTGPSTLPLKPLTPTFLKNTPVSAFPSISFTPPLPAWA